MAQASSRAFFLVFFSFTGEINRNSLHPLKMMGSKNGENSLVLSE
jgi:hypothetical protein